MTPTTRIQVQVGSLTVKIILLVKNLNEDPLANCHSAGLSSRLPVSRPVTAPCMRTLDTRIEGFLLFQGWSPVYQQLLSRSTQIRDTSLFDTSSLSRKRKSIFTRQSHRHAGHVIYLFFLPNFLQVEVSSLCPNSAVHALFGQRQNLLSDKLRFSEKSLFKHLK